MTVLSIATVRRSALALAALALDGGLVGAIADEPPMPPPRPPELRAPGEPPPPAPNGAQASICLAKLTAAGASAETAPAPVASVDGCAIDAPVRLSSITVTGGDVVALPDRPLLNCEFASVLADYVRLIVAPLGQAMLHAKVAAIETGPGYECRTQDRMAGAKISAHGHGLAVDFGAILLADKRRRAAGSGRCWVRALTRSTPTTCTSTSNGMTRAGAIAFASSGRGSAVKSHIAQARCRTTSSHV
jgi:hypothetical protein